MISKQEAMARAEAVFNAAADHFDAPALSFWNRFGQRTIDRLGLRVGDRVLDLCCGSGASALPAARAVGPTGHVLGVDVAESLLQLGRNKAQQQGLSNIVFQKADFETLGLADASFDAVVCVFGIFFVPDMAAAVAELWRMVRPGGKLAVTSWGEKVFEPANQQFWDAIKAERPDLVKAFTPWEQIREPAALEALLEAGGASNVTVFPKACIHELSSPEDWWTMVMGGGCRGTLNQLDPVTKERVRAVNLHFLETNGIHALEADVLYAVAQK
jgi:ubiquinone/menaquinone biosynthesis C-methylase UbiE